MLKGKNEKKFFVDSQTKSSQMKIPKDSQE